ncbi:hypothetical protein ElyMa_000772300 [Elysia marginata]|uniref:Uncharacterized protein n=1 Tax=Elysia marginata TaxID=1093978 RepID=A0AAV4GT70_9GAST|nr:hypothetical protein ElyMa_000772300 [Elysia marginata]
MSSSVRFLQHHNRKHSDRQKLGSTYRGRADGDTLEPPTSDTQPSTEASESDLTAMGFVVPTRSTATKKERKVEQVQQVTLGCPWERDEWAHAAGDTQSSSGKKKNFIR